MGEGQEATTYLVYLMEEAERCDNISALLFLWVHHYAVICQVSVGRGKDRLTNQQIARRGF